MKREQVLPQVMADMAQRIANGAKEYGEPLTTFNGRDALQDGYEEALDLAVYLKQALMERASATYPVVVLGKDKLESVPYAQRGDPNMVYGYSIPRAERDAMVAARTAQGAAIANMPSAIGAACIPPELQALYEKAELAIKKATQLPDWPGPDWSQAPEWAVWWACAENGICFWYSAEPGIVRAKSCHIWTMQQAPSEMQASPKWAYTGDWRESLRKRPE